MSVKTFAAIDVGSFELTMKIFDLSGKNTMREIDCIRQRIDLGSDTYAHGKISNEKIDDLCHTLKEFAQIMESYKVTAYKAYGTSAIRETENTLILQDQIEQRTGIWVETLSNSEQRFLDYKSIASKGETFRRIIEEKTAILELTQPHITALFYVHSAALTLTMASKSSPSSPPTVRSSASVESLTGMPFLSFSLRESTSISPEV